MTHDMQINILMADRCTRKEAEWFIKHHCTIYEESDVDELLNSVNEFKDEDEEIYTVDDLDAWNVPDVHPITFEGKKYYIVYVL